jgi:lipid A 3-O-deacylase
MFPQTRRMRSLLLAILFAFVPGTVRAQSDQSEETTHLIDEEPIGLASISASWENDGRFYQLLDDSDRWYTNGVKLDFSFTRPWPRVAARALPFQYVYDQPRKAGGIVLAQEIYTPEDLQTPTLITDDRPYAGYLYAGLYVQQADDFRMDHLELDLGVVGSWSQAEAAQKQVHALLPNQVKPRGWDNQLSNEFTVNLNYEHRWRTPKARVLDFEMDLIGAVGGRAGNVHTDLNASVTGRIGYNLPHDFGPSSIESFRDATGTWAEDFGIYVYGRATGRAVAHDIFLDGNTFANSYSIGHKELVAELQAGVMLHYRWFETGWADTWQSETFDGQSEPQVYGAWVVTARFTY